MFSGYATISGSSPRFEYRFVNIRAVGFEHSRNGEMVELTTRTL